MAFAVESRLEGTEKVSNHALSPYENVSLDQLNLAIHALTTMQTLKEVKELDSSALDKALTDMTVYVRMVDMAYQYQKSGGKYHALVD